MTEVQGTGRNRKEEFSDLLHPKGCSGFKQGREAVPQDLTMNGTEAIYTVAQDMTYGGVSEAGIASKFAKSPVLFHVGLRILTLIPFLSYSGNSHQTQTEASLTPSRLPFR